MIDWTPERVADLCALRRLGFSYSEIGRKLNTTRSAIGGVVRRHVYRIPDGRGRHDGHPPPFVEPWAQFTARKKAEREAAKAALSEFTSAGQDAD